jgi:hypothetical protein
MPAGFGVFKNAAIEIGIGRRHLTGKRAGAK